MSPPSPALPTSTAPTASATPAACTGSSKRGQQSLDFLFSYLEEEKRRRQQEAVDSSSNPLLSLIESSSGAAGPQNGSPAGAGSGYRLHHQLRNSLRDFSYHDVPATIRNRLKEAKSHRLTVRDVECEVFDWIFQHLDERKCPHSLAVGLAIQVAKASLQKVLSHVDIQVPTVSSTSQPLDFVADSTSLRAESLDMLYNICTDLASANPAEAAALCDQFDSGPAVLSSTSAVRNQRRTMEDRHVVIHDLSKVCNINSPGKRYSYYAVFDGHAGVDAATYAAAHLHHNLVQTQAFKDGDMVDALKIAFKVTDADFLQRSALTNLKSGCTAICCLKQGHERMFFAWAGDSQAILVRDGRAIDLTPAHKPDGVQERLRIEEMGGKVIQLDTWRVDGTLAVSRAIGDPDHKPYVTADPEVVEIEIEKGDDFIVIACDGLWDQVTPEEATQIVYEHLEQSDATDPEEAGRRVAAKLVEGAKHYGSQDNITAVVVFLKDIQSIVSTGKSDYYTMEPSNQSISSQQQPPSDDLDFGSAFQSNGHIYSDYDTTAEEELFSLTHSQMIEAGSGEDSAGLPEPSARDPAQDSDAEASSSGAGRVSVPASGLLLANGFGHAADRVSDDAEASVDADAFETQASVSSSSSRIDGTESELLTHDHQEVHLMDHQPSCPFVGEQEADLHVPLHSPTSSSNMHLLHPASGTDASDLPADSSRRNNRPGDEDLMECWNEDRGHHDNQDQGGQQHFSADPTNSTTAFTPGSSMAWTGMQRQEDEEEGRQAGEREQQEEEEEGGEGSAQASQACLLPTHAAAPKAVECDEHVDNDDELEQLDEPHLQQQLQPEREDAVLHQPSSSHQQQERDEVLNPESVVASVTKELEDLVHDNGSAGDHSDLDDDSQDSQASDTDSVQYLVWNQSPSGADVTVVAPDASAPTTTDQPAEQVDAAAAAAAAVSPLEAEAEEAGEAVLRQQAEQADLQQAAGEEEGGEERMDQPPQPGILDQEPEQTGDSLPPTPTFVPAATTTTVTAEIAEVGAEAASPICLDDEIADPSSPSPAFSPDARSPVPDYSTDPQQILDLLPSADSTHAWEQQQNGHQETTCLTIPVDAVPDYDAPLDLQQVAAEHLIESAEVPQDLEMKGSSSRPSSPLKSVQFAGSSPVPDYDAPAATASTSSRPGSPVKGPGSPVRSPSPSRVQIPTPRSASPSKVGLDLDQENERAAQMTRAVEIDTLIDTRSEVPIPVTIPVTMEEAKAKSPSPVPPPTLPSVPAPIMSASLTSLSRRSVSPVKSLMEELSAASAAAAAASSSSASAAGNRNNTQSWQAEESTQRKDQQEFYLEETVEEMEERTTETTTTTLTQQQADDGIHTTSVTEERSEETIVHSPVRTPVIKSAATVAAAASVVGAAAAASRPASKTAAPTKAPAAGAASRLTTVPLKAKAGNASTTVSNGLSKGPAAKPAATRTAVTSTSRLTSAASKPATTAARTTAAAGATSATRTGTVGAVKKTAAPSSTLTAARTGAATSATRTGAAASAPRTTTTGASRVTAAAKAPLSNGVSKPTAAKSSSVLNGTKTGTPTATRPALSSTSRLTSAAPRAASATRSSVAPAAKTAAATAGTKATSVTDGAKKTAPATSSTTRVGLTSRATAAPKTSSSTTSAAAKTGTTSSSRLTAATKAPTLNGVSKPPTSLASKTTTSATSRPAPLASTSRLASSSTAAAASASRLTASRTTTSATTAPRTGVAGTKATATTTSLAAKKPTTAGTTAPRVGLAARAKAAAAPAPAALTTNGVSRPVTRATPGKATAAAATKTTNPKPVTPDLAVAAAPQTPDVVPDAIAQVPAEPAAEDKVVTTTDMVLIEAEAAIETQ